MNTTTHPKPMMIKAEYTQTLNEGRTPRTLLSAVYLARRKAGRPGADEKNNFYEHGQARSITYAGGLEAIEHYIRSYNERRIKLTLDGVSPAQYRRSL